MKIISFIVLNRSTGKNCLLLAAALLFHLIFLMTTALAVAPDVPIIASPANSSSHTGGDYINFTGSCNDTEDGALSEGDLAWTSSQDGALGTGQALSINTLQSGTHTITLTATDSESLSNATSISITVTNNAPTATITNPSNGNSFNAGSAVTFSGIGTDIDSGDTLTYSWTSTTGGNPPAVIGTGSIIAVSTLAVGTHVIIFTVSDGQGGVTESTPITIEITNNAPTATILSPSDNDTFYSGDTINFNGTGSDPEDPSGSLTYAWSCSEHGPLSALPTFSDNTLVDGDHTITFTVTDTQGTSNSTPASIDIHVGNYDPVADITAPATGTSYDMDDVIVFQGGATDIEDGILTGASLVWSSDIGGVIGTGDTVTSSTLASGTHIITLTATDDYIAPASGTDSIIITISNTFPTVTIANPADNSSFYVSENVTFSGSASDAEDGILSGASLTWSSSLDGSLGTGSPLTINTLTSGTHSITLTATDSESASTISTPITVSIGNAVPVADITAPSDASSYNRGETITFRGIATDDEDGNLTGGSLVWSSNISGVLGTGTIFPLDTLVTGTHTITLTATDSQGSSGSGSIAVTINNNPPAVTINSPPDNSIYEEGTTISFTGTASDPEDGFISDVSLSWFSSLDGPLGTGTSISSTLTKGTHIVSLTATDSEGDTGSATLTIFVGNNPPTVSIDSPLSGTNYDTGEFITFQGTSADAEDGILSGASLRWSSSLDGDFATGQSPPQLNTLSTGLHEITLIATDSNNAVTYSTPISIRVGNIAPVATILNPSNNESFENGETILFEGTGIDAEDGVLLTTSLVWTSTREGQIGTGTSFSTATLSGGEHTITLTATDTDNASHSTSITIFAQNATPVVSIDNPVSGISVDEGNSITFQGSASDNEDGFLTGSSLVWTSNFDGELGTGTSLTLDSLSSGTHTITLTATDSLTTSGSASITLTIVPMTLSATTLSIAKGQTETITIIGGKSPYRAATRRSQIALPDENNGIVIIEGLSEGSTIITITDNKKNSAEVSVTVSDSPYSPNDQLPDADAGPDQSGIDENERVYLTGSNANLLSPGSSSFLWVQTDPANPTEALAEPTVVLSDYISQTPSFIAPLVDINGQTLAFQLTVTNQAGSDSDIVMITLDTNGITEFPPDTATFHSSTGLNMAAKVTGGGDLTMLNAVDPMDLNVSVLPQSIIYGLIDIKVRVPVAGATATVIVYLPEAAPEDHKWYKYITSENTWVDFDRELISSGTGDGAVFSPDRRSVTLYITDDSRYDDNTEDGIIHDPSGLGKPPITAVSTHSGSDDDSYGCFINSGR